MRGDFKKSGGLANSGGTERGLGLRGFELTNPSVLFTHY